MPFQLPELSVDQIPIARRTFLKSCSVLALALSGCSALLPKTRFADLMLNDPHPDDYRPVLLDLVKAILPFEDPRFPSLSPDAVESRLLTLFPIERDTRFGVLRKSLLFFNELTLYPHVLAPIAQEEQPDGRNTEEALAAQGRSDEDRYNLFLQSLEKPEQQYKGLSLEKKREYLRMWSQSAFLVKRQFYRSSKALVMITGYSMDELWKAIGYKGPLLEEKGG